MSNLTRTSPSTTPEFIGKPDYAYPFINYPTPDTYARIIRRQMKQASPPFSPIVGTRTSMTNLLLQSEALGTTWVQNAVTIGSNGVANPNDGTVNADKVIDSAANSAHSLSQAVTIAAGSTYTFAVAVLASGRTRGRIRFGDSAFASVVADLEYDLTAGTATGTQTTGTPTISNVLILSLPNSSWFYLLFSVRLDGVTTAAAVAHALHNGTSYTYAGDGASGAYFYRPTLVLGSYTRIPLIDTTTTTRTILAPEVYPDDPFAYIVREDDRPTKLANEEMTWERVYATIPKSQTSYPGSRIFVKPPYSEGDAFNPFDAGATALGAATLISDLSSSLGNASYSAASGVYTDGDGKVYSPIKTPSSQAVCYATAGTFTLTYKTSTTAALAYNASGATIAAAVNALADIIADSITVTCPANALSNASTGGGIDISLTAGSTTTAITMDATGLTVNLSKNPKTTKWSSTYQQVKLPTHLTITGHGLNTALDLVVSYPSGGRTLVHEVGFWGSIDADTIWVPGFGNNGYSAQYAGNYSSTYTAPAASTYVGGHRLVRTKDIETFYLAGVTSGISSPEDIATPTGLQNPNSFLTALLTPLTGYQSYDSDGPDPWEGTLIHKLRNTFVKFEDLV